MSKFSAGGGQLSPIGSSRENSRKGTIFASFLSIIDSIYVITKTRIQKTMNYIVRERWLYNQCLGSFCMHAIYNVYTGVKMLGNTLDKSGLLFGLVHWDT